MFQNPGPHKIHRFGTTSQGFYGLSFCLSTSLRSQNWLCVHHWCWVWKPFAILTPQPTHWFSGPLVWADQQSHHLMMECPSWKVHPGCSTLHCECSGKVWLLLWDHLVRLQDPNCPQLSTNICGGVSGMPVSNSWMNVGVMHDRFPPIFWWESHHWYPLKILPNSWRMEEHHAWIYCIPIFKNLQPLTNTGSHQ